MKRPLKFTFVVIAVIVLMLLAIACGGGGSSSKGSALPAFVTTTISDPPTCSRTAGGNFQRMLVTIADVQIHQSATAGDNDSGWISLTPGLKSAPKQVDLLAIGNTGCFLAELGSKTQIDAGTYQQIRIILAPANTQVAGNACVSGAHCVYTSDGAFHALDLSSEATTGIKIPSGQIAGGKFTVGDGETKGLNIDFDGCRSLVSQGANGRYRLKPVLHAGEVSLSSNAITGSLIVSGTTTPVTNSKAIVALEQKDANGVNRVVMQTMADGNGQFIFCPVPAGTYDVVVVAMTVAGTNPNESYATTIITGVQPGAALGNIPMVLTSGTNKAQASITGTVSTASSTAGVAADVAVSALQKVSLGSNDVLVTVPLVQQQNSVITVTTATGSTCTANTACASYELAVPAAQPNVAAFATTNMSYTQSTATPVNYVVGAQAFKVDGAGATNCSPSEVQVSTAQVGGSISVTAGAVTAASPINFTGCQ